MNWVQINERIMELEAISYLTKDQIKEWNKLVSSKVAGILNRKKINEEDYRETKTEGKRT